MGAAASWVGFVGGTAASYAFGFGTLASGGIGLALGLAIGAGYAASHQS